MGATPSPSQGILPSWPDSVADAKRRRGRSKEGGGRQAKRRSQGAGDVSAGGANRLA